MGSVSMMGRTAIFRVVLAGWLFATASVGTPGAVLGVQAASKSKNPNREVKIFRFIEVRFLVKALIGNNYYGRQSYPLVKIIRVLMLILTKFV